jgi:hypothetical protein
MPTLKSLARPRDALSAGLREILCRHYRQFYPPELRQLVAQIYARDIELFGYSFAD